jgi:serine phosphatase RsbU (regulator of sigma subunit)
MLGLATAVANFMSRQVGGYVAAAVREVEVRRQRDRLRHDLEIAREIQQRLLPNSLPDFTGYQFAAVSRPADQTGGDYYDWQEICPHRAVFSLGDVTGHGVGPALVTAACRAYVRAILGNEPVPATVLERVNKLLHADLTEGRFVTLALVDLNAETNEVRLLSAGHGPTLYVRGSDGDVKQIDSQGLPLGLYEDGMLEAPVQFHLDPGDLVVLCSDGFFEPSNVSGEEFGLDRLTRVISEHRHEPPTRIVAAMEHAVCRFLNTAPQPDDMTAFIIKRTT